MLYKAALARSACLRLIEIYRIVLSALAAVLSPMLWKIKGLFVHYAS